MKNRSQMRHTRFSDAGRSFNPRTGDHCPVNGWWAPLNGEGDACYLTEGSIMPSVHGMPGTWTLAARPQQAAYAAGPDNSLRSWLDVL